MSDVMIDIETLSNRFDAPVISIGAVFFNLETGETKQTFLARIDPNDAMNFGRANGETLRWWMEQGDDARRNAMSGQQTLKSALDGLSGFVRSDAMVWGNGPSFDMTVLEHAYARTGVAVPWKFWNVQCCRTIKRLATGLGWAQPERQGVHHDALDDAVYQAQWVSSAWCHLQAKQKGNREVEDLA